jgi:hypothetical protein
LSTCSAGWQGSATFGLRLVWVALMKEVNSQIFFRDETDCLTVNRH